MPDTPDENFLDFDDEDLDDEAFLAAWDEADRHAAGIITNGLPEGGVARPDDKTVQAAADRARQLAGQEEGSGAAWAIRAAQVTDAAAVGDAELLTRAVAATIAFVDDPGLPAEQQASMMTLEHADWIGAVLGCVRAGPGVHVTGDVLADMADTTPEIEGPPVEPDERDMIAYGFDLILPAWQDCGLLDHDGWLTDLGVWVLPRAAVLAWTGETPPEAPH